MSDVNSLFKKKKGKSKALDLKAASAPKKTPKSKTEKQKEATEDDEWKSETKKAVVLTNGKAAEEFGKKYTEEVVYDEDMDMATKIEIDDTRKMLQDVIQRSTVVETTPPPPPEEKKEEVAAPVVDVKKLSLEERFALSAATSKYVARGGVSKPAGPKKSLEEEYPSLSVAVAKTTPTPSTKKATKPSKLNATDEPPVNETVFRVDEAASSASVVTEKEEERQEQGGGLSEEAPTVTPISSPPAPATTASSTATIVKEVVDNKTEGEATKVAEAVKEPEVVVKKDVKKKKKKGGAFEI